MAALTIWTFVRVHTLILSTRPSIIFLGLLLNMAIKHCCYYILPACQ